MSADNPESAPAATAQASVASKPPVLSRAQLIAVGAAGFMAGALAFMVAAGRLSHPTQAAGGTARTGAPAAPSAPGSVVPPEIVRSWTGRRQAGWGSDGTRTIAFTLDASNDVPLGPARSAPQMVARCQARQVELYVVTGPLAFEEPADLHTVWVQIDDGPEQRQQWFASDSSHEVFAPDGLDAVRTLAHAHRMRFKYLPYQTLPVTAVFSFEGFDQLAPLVARACGTRLEPSVRPALRRSN